MNGLLTLREDFPDIPVIILTSDSSIETVTAAFENNARGFVVKGESPHVLVTAVRTVLAGGVITSYSIHYTKLYEDAPRDRP